MRSFIFKVLDFTIRILVRVRNRFADPVPEARLLRAMFKPQILHGFRRLEACKAGCPEAWTVEEILRREG